MGNRISIRFVSEGDYKSATLFSHWDGEELLEKVQIYLDNLYSELEGSIYPLNRKEPETVMVDFIRWLTKAEERIYSNYYIVPTPDDGDNSDNGHYDIVLYKDKYIIEKNKDKR
jgi:hypothetical protein